MPKVKETPSTPTPRWIIYALIALLLAALAAWGSRERTYKHTLQIETSQRSSAEERATKAETKITQLDQQYKSEIAKAYDRAKRRTERRLPDGTIEISEEEIERSREEAKAEASQKIREQYETQLTEAKTTATNLSHRVNELELEITKGAPRWYAGLDWQPLQGTTAAAFSPQLGMNLGAFTIYAAHPLALELAPRLGAGLRF